MTKVIKCLTVLQPYASAFFDAPTPKLTENRGRNTNVRGPVLIHAGLKLFPRSSVDHCRSMGWNVPNLDRLPRGVILGAGLLYDCDTFAIQPGGDPDPWAAGPFCLRFKSMLKFEHPVAWRGAQGFWGLTQEELCAVLINAGLRYVVACGASPEALQLDKRLAELAGWDRSLEYPEDVAVIHATLKLCGLVAADGDIDAAYRAYSEDVCASWLKLPDDPALMKDLVYVLINQGMRVQVVPT